MNRFVQPLAFLSIEVAEIADSIERIEVVPTAQTFLPADLERLTISTAGSGTLKYSASILCLDRSSTSIFRKVPKPM